MHDAGKAPLVLLLDRHHLASGALGDERLLQHAARSGRPQLPLHDRVHRRRGLTQLAAQRLQLGRGRVGDPALLVERRVDARAQVRVVRQRRDDAPKRRRVRAVGLHGAAGQAHGAKLRRHGLQVRGAQARSSGRGVGRRANVLRPADAESRRLAQQPARLSGGGQPGSSLGMVGGRPQRADVRPNPDRIRRTRWPAPGISGSSRRSADRSDASMDASGVPARKRGSR